MLLIAAALLTGSVLAWFTNFDSVDDLGFKILQIDSEVRMYYANDSNFNGVPDLLLPENANKYYNDYAERNEEGEIVNPSYQTYAEYTNVYYNEKFDFTLKDSKIALSSDSAVNQFNRIDLTEVVPSKIYTFKFELINYVGADNALSFGFDSEYSGSLENLSKFQCRLAVINSSDGENATYDFTEWTDFSNGSTYGGIVLNDDIVINGINEFTRLSGRKDLWLQIRMKDNVQNIELTEFALPDFKITFTFDYENI